jgi:hypothetical protein
LGRLVDRRIFGCSLREVKSRVAMVVDRSSRVVMVRRGGVDETCR